MIVHTPSPSHISLSLARRLVLLLFFVVAISQVALPLSFHWCSPRSARSLAFGLSMALARQWATPIIVSRLPIPLLTNTCLVPKPPKRASASGTKPTSSSRPPDQCFHFCFHPTIHLLPNLNQPSTPLPSPSHPQRRKTNGIEKPNALLRRVSSDSFFILFLCLLCYCLVACIGHLHFRSCRRRRQSR